MTSAGAITKRLLVLVVDDEPANLDTFKRAFRKEFDARVASGGDEALALIGDVEFDAVLIDHAMPAMNGLELAQKASAIRPGMVKLMLTAHGDLPEVRAAHKSGLVDGIILKPWDHDGLLHWVTNAVRVASMRRSINVMNSVVLKKPSS